MLPEFDSDQAVAVRVSYRRLNVNAVLPISRMIWADYLDLATFPLVFAACILGSVLTLIVTYRRASWNSRGEWYLAHAIFCALAWSDMLGMYV